MKHFEEESYEKYQQQIALFNYDEVNILLGFQLWLFYNSEVNFNFESIELKVKELTTDELVRLSKDYKQKDEYKIQIVNNEYASFNEKKAIEYLSAANCKIEFKVKLGIEDRSAEKTS